MHAVTDILCQNTTWHGGPYLGLLQLHTIKVLLPSLLVCFGLNAASSHQYRSSMIALCISERIHSFGGLIRTRSRTPLDSV
ncbi:hypothetical protein XENTR_v10020785 [Xenopus tropicalis]|nr:hypothetical protein XENTR_v10020785 [Xenopus tropicalis]